MCCAGLVDFNNVVVVDSLWWFGFGLLVWLCVCFCLLVRLAFGVLVGCVLFWVGLVF